MYKHAYWLKRVPGFIRGIDPLYHTTFERLFDRVRFELDLYEESDPECDIKTKGQAFLVAKFMDGMLHAHADRIDETQACPCGACRYARYREQK